MSALVRMLGERFVGDRPSREHEIVALEQQWGAELPADHRRFLLEHGRFDGTLIDANGDEVVDQFRILSVAGIDDDLGYAVFEDAPELLPVAGMDGWRYCLRRREDGTVDYIDVDLGNGKVAEGFGRTLEELVAAVIARRRAG